MKNLLNIILISFFLFSCSKKTHPIKSETSTTVTKTETKVVKPVAPKVKTPVPNVIVVNDAAAKKAVDGRIYYDLDGKRYWKNFKDGKFYLYNKSMHSNPDFKVPK